MRRLSKVFKLFAIMLIVGTTTACAAYLKLTPPAPQVASMALTAIVKVGDDWKGKNSRATPIGPNTVMTAWHCVSDMDECYINIGNRLYIGNLVVLLPMEPEPIAVLYIGGDEPVFKPHQIFTIDEDGDLPRKIIGPKGPEPWAPNIVVPGYSGSPVLDKDGELVGIVYGYDYAKNPLYLPVPTNYWR